MLRPREAASSGTAPRDPAPPELVPTPSRKRAGDSPAPGIAVRRLVATALGLLVVAGVLATTPPAAEPAIASSPGSTVEKVFAQRDADVVERRPDVNRGQRRKLGAKSTPQRVSFIRFEVPDGMGNIANAELKLRVTSDVDTRIAVHKSAKNWRESTVTFANAPEIRKRLGTARLSAGTTRWIAVDVGAVVDGPGVYSFAVVGLTERTAVFKSSETGAPPRLLLTIAPAPPVPGQPVPPIRAAFMYPWFPNAWDQGGTYPFTQYSPSLGLYDSADPTTIDAQVALATGAGLQAFIASWWGTGHHTDTATLAVLDRIPVSPNPAFRLAVYYEEEGQSDPSPAEIVGDLTSLERLFDKPAYLRIDDAPVVFVWAESSDASDMASRWAQAKTQYGKDLHVVLKVYSGYRDDPNQPDSWHQYGPATAYSEHLPWSAVVSPGFWHANEPSARLDRNPNRFRSDVRQMVVSDAYWQLVTSWNEWGEGTSVEPGDEWDMTFLDILADEFGAATATPPTTTTTTTTEPPPTTTTTTAAPPGGGLVFAAGGDWGANSDTDATMAAIAGSDAEFLLALGDLSYGDATASQWCSYVKGYLGATFPVELVVGNHEDDDRVDGYIGDFTPCLPDRMGATGTYGAEYSFDVAGLARVIMIGAGNDVAGVKYDYEAGNARYQWLANTIDDARADGIPWVIVGMHKVCITAGEKSCEIGTDLTDLLLDKRVDLILQGHEHNYQRSKQLTCATPNQYRPECVADDGADGRYTKGAGSVFVVSGATGGGGEYAIYTNDPEIDYFAAWHGGNSPNHGRGYLLVTLTPTHLDLEFIGTTTPYTDHATID